MRPVGLIAGTLAAAALLAGCSEVPEVVGQSREAATAAIAAAWLRTDASPPAVESMVAIDAVVSQDPAAGARVAWGSRVSIARSAGTTIGDYVGDVAEAAQAELAGRGFTVTLADTEADGVDAGIVAGQTPAAGTVFSAPDGVVLSVAVGPWIAVPDLANVASDAAKDRLSALTLTSEVAGPDETGSVKLPCNAARDFCATCEFRAVVRTTEPAAGTLVFPNATVRLVTEEERYDCNEPLRTCEEGEGCLPL